ncbi:MAG: cyclopropane-fatty-acyl-phospholipid synthase family protein [Zetaproteobacteria bacterium]|nr:MAG: cyclopropane-fatty-acyl-phospholipid synthase family protein [Zetaproteobacteria bacterium]
MGEDDSWMSQIVAGTTTKVRQSGTVTVFDRWALRRFLNTIGNPPVPFALWDGVDVYASDAEPVGRIVIHDRKSFINMQLNPNLGFGDGFSAGSIEVEGDFTACLEALLRAMPVGVDVSMLTKVMRLLPSMRANTLSRSRENIHRHYDIGNDFYRLWLDKELVYSCAYYTTDSDTLEAAQLKKMDHVCRKLRLKPGETVVEAGCGWGALARHMVRHYGVKVRAYNISHEQIKYAQERAIAEGLDDRVEYIEDDYRNITGEYDVFASVGLLEHVGRENYKTLGAVIDRSLKEGGRGLIHSVGRSKPLPIGEWIEKRIFPGSYVPSLCEMIDIFEPHDLSVLDVENLRLHYAKTLKEWLERFDDASDTVENMYDAPFVRAWRLYLGGCSAAFASGDLQLFQVLFNRERNNDTPWTRAHLYHD